MRTLLSGIVISTITMVSVLPGARAQDAAGASEPAAAPLVAALQQDGTGTVQWVADFLGRHTGNWGNRQMLGIELWRYAALLTLLLITFVLARCGRLVLEKYALKAAARTRWQIDDLVFEHAGRPLSLLVHSLGVYLAVMCFMAGSAPPAVQAFFGRACFGVAAAAVLWYIYRLIDVVDHYLKRLAQNTNNALDDAFADVVRKTLRLAVLVIGTMVIAKNVLDWDITALLASAGILGLAVAFAAQDMIANFFGTLMLLLDRPFKVGERIKLGGADGPIESIGFRSTRIRTLDGHQVSIPNREVANAAIENVGRRPHIKRVSNITITYDTPLAKVERALAIVRGILADHPGMDPDFPPRVYFNEFNDCSLNLLMIAWYHPAEYWDYLEWCEQVNLELMRQFEREGIEFAFPTTTTYLAHDPARPLTITTQHAGSVAGTEPSPAGKNRE